MTKTKTKSALRVHLSRFEWNSLICSSRLANIGLIRFSITSDARLLIVLFAPDTHQRPFITLDATDVEGLVVSLVQVLAVSRRDYIH
jgi:hypothetical protein